MSHAAPSLKNPFFKTLSVALTTLMVGCGGSELVDINLPSAIVVDQPFEVTVDHVMDSEYDSLGSDNGSLVFAAIVPDTWSAISASYEGTAGAVPYATGVTISGAPPETSAEVEVEFAAFLEDIVGIGAGDILCGGTVALREGPLPTDPLISALFSARTPSDFVSHTADSFSLAPYAGDMIYVVADMASCIGPNSLQIDSFVLDAGTGNLVSNASFESGFASWDTSDSGVDCINEILEEGDFTDGTGWLVPAPSDGAFLYANDASNPTRCVLAQEISVPGGAAATTFSASIGANIALPFLFFLDAEILGLEIEPGLQTLWFRTGDIALYDDLDDGDSGQLSITFVASQESIDTQEVVFLHGQYAEIPEEEIIAVMADAIPAMRRLAPSAGGAPVATPDPVVAPLATPGFVGVGLWFMEDSGGPSAVPDSISASISILGATEIPALSGFLLLMLSVIVGALGLNRRRLKK